MMTPKQGSVAEKNPCNSYNVDTAQFYLSLIEGILQKFVMTIAAKKKIPDIGITVIDSSGQRITKTGQIFSSSLAVLFTVPGAFTPTCSARHLPGFMAHSEALQAKGVDLIACLSVNDAFVMEAWAKKVGSGDAVLMIADGNADLVRALGLHIDQSAQGMGMRAQRSAMIIRDGVIQKILIEPKGSFGISSAESVLKAL